MSSSPQQAVGRFWRKRSSSWGERQQSAGEQGGRLCDTCGAAGCHGLARHGHNLLSKISATCQGGHTHIFCGQMGLPGQVLVRLWGWTLLPQASQICAEAPWDTIPAQHGQQLRGRHTGASGQAQPKSTQGSYHSRLTSCALTQPGSCKAQPRAGDSVIPSPATSPVNGDSITSLS